MKKLQFASILSSGLFACVLGFSTLASSAAEAQDFNSAKVDVPFAFQTGSVRMPAGLYQIDQSDHVVVLRGPDQVSEFIVMHSTVNRSRSSQGKIIFHRYGNKYFLSQIWRAGETTGLECSRSRAEKDVVLAKNTQAPDTIQLALYTAPQR
jgi:hypothetical protein